MFSDGSPLLDASGSEIRTTGKNHLKTPFTPKYLKKILNEKNCIIERDLCKIHKDDLFNQVHGRGQNKQVISRLKISHAFYVKMDFVTTDGDYYKFSMEKIYQNKAGISLHVDINNTKEQICKLLKYDTGISRV